MSAEVYRTGSSSRGQSSPGWNLELTARGATIQTPPFTAKVYHTPFLRLNWRASGLEQSNRYVEWMTKDAPQFSVDRRVHFVPAAMEGESRVALNSGAQNTTLEQQAAEVRTMISMYKTSRGRERSPPCASASTIPDPRG
ncbi:MAG: hypothetical protein H0U13_16860, partial [Gemmatimonadaceae bacterium]|nr:hypothetical protein [Gemmatimonadaceae bacterium]